MEESLSSEDELSENRKTNVNTATTASATGGKGKRKRSANVPFQLTALMFMKTKRGTALIYQLSFLNTLAFLLFAFNTRLNLSNSR